ncbi:MAG: aspartate carbamoyltransferase regulatory subunit, partial [Candidatus Bathyarchaeia archaeon]
MRDEKDLRIQKIENGTVIDHITAGYALDVLRILNMDGKDGHVISIAMNVRSDKMGKKDIVKIENRELRQQEVDKIALLAPKATINIIRDYGVAQKTRVRLPEVIRDIVRCDNPVCISNAKEPVEPKFYVVSTGPLLLRCHYCGREMGRE